MSGDTHINSPTYIRFQKAVQIMCDVIVKSHRKTNTSIYSCKNYFGKLTYEGGNVPT